MKARLIKASLTSAALILACSVQAQYSLTWSRIAGGGGTTTGGGYSLSGTVGQQDADSPTSGGISSGFWSAFSSGEVRPILSLSLGNNTMTLSWPLSSIGYNLEQAPVLLPGSWITIAPPYPSNLAGFYFSLAPPPERIFFRLHKP